MWLKYAVLFFYAIVVKSGEIGDKCVPNDDVTDGSCMIITDCKVAVRAIRQNYFHPFTRCGFHQVMEIVCCPPEDYVLPGKNKNTERPRTTTVPPLTTTVSVKKQAEDRPKRIAEIECQKIIEKSGPPLDLHIVGGSVASPGEFPHMAALAYKREEGYLFQCGGSLISESFILSAAHCVDTLDMIKPEFARLGTVLLGSRDFNDTTDTRVTDIYLFPEYKRISKYHDLALLRLEKPVRFTEDLSPICLYTSISDPEIPLMVTGWGRTDFKRDDGSEVLLKARISAVAVSKCREHYDAYRRLPDGVIPAQICAGDQNGLKDSCQGDSGGPLQVLNSDDSRYRLVGITSFGRGCGSPVPGVYTRVAHYLDWIETNVWPQSKL
ncbi:serine protease persephone-like [Aricia agestis]|uniref:serine protease persephone-like n=1 Tax=Aricia agestis TaxID=91739 RepID=UPI001C208ACA|nr:serine protease persephone-like [Aricia agestis]